MLGHQWVEYHTPITDPEYHQKTVNLFSRWYLIGTMRFELLRYLFLNTVLLSSIWIYMYMNILNRVLYFHWKPFDSICWLVATGCMIYVIRMRIILIIYQISWLHKWMSSTTGQYTKTPRIRLYLHKAICVINAYHPHHIDGLMQERRNSHA